MKALLLLPVRLLALCAMYALLYFLLGVGWVALKLDELFGDKE